MKTLALIAYQFLLHLYPPAFRKRFGDEMFTLAEGASRSEWVLIFCDTSTGIVKEWLQPSDSAAGGVPSSEAGYISLSDSVVTPLRLTQGLGLATAVLVLLCLVNTAGPSVQPSYHLCRAAYMVSMK